MRKLKRQIVKAAMKEVGVERINRKIKAVMNKDGGKLMVEKAFPFRKDL